MKITELIKEESLQKLPVAFHFFEPIDKDGVILIAPHAGIKKYGTVFCHVYPSPKPISKII